VRYTGLIAVNATTPTLRDGPTVRDVLLTVTSFQRVIFTGGRLLPSHQFLTFMKLYAREAQLPDEERSVATVAGLLPAEWTKTTTDRTIDLVVPSPTTTTTTTLPPSMLGDWSGQATILPAGGGGGSTHDAGLTVQTEGDHLRIWFCNSVESFCDGSAMTQQCALQFTATASGLSFTGTGVDNNPPCCIGCVGQNRVYGCPINATLSGSANGQQTLEGDFGGSVTFCPSASPVVTTHFKFCRPNPCPVPPASPPPGGN
jgi:hypothetical protein